MTPSNDKHPTRPRPAVDEWGMYDPEQAGLAALFDRLDPQRHSAADADAPAVAESMSRARQLLEEDLDESGHES
ncbi:MAG: hypothetical protein AB1635_17415 [Acidobacteriota bacterium]